jgi:hypothetical protein
MYLCVIRSYRSQFLGFMGSSGASKHCCLHGLLIICRHPEVDAKFHLGSGNVGRCELTRLL